MKARHKTKADLGTPIFRRLKPIAKCRRGAEPISAPRYANHSVPDHQVSHGSGLYWLAI